MTQPLWSSVGPVELLLVADGIEPVTPRFLFRDAPEVELRAAVADRLDAGGLIANPVNCLLIRTRGRVALVDTGAGQLAERVGATTGGLERALRREGIEPGDVDVVVITHAHPDHIGGLTRDGEPLFPHATHLIDAAEPRYWSDRGTAGRLPGFMAAMPAIVADALTPLEQRGLLAPVNGGAEVLPGVRMVPAPGHTPGHSVVEIGYGTPRAAFLADAVLDEAGLAQPGWVSATDADPERAVGTRRAILERAARTGALVLATHLGRTGAVERSGSAFALRPAG